MIKDMHVTAGMVVFGEVAMALTVIWFNWKHIL
jgi:hypothetical protein